MEVIICRVVKTLAEAVRIKRIKNLKETKKRQLFKKSERYDDKEVVIRNGREGQIYPREIQTQNKNEKEGR